MRENRLNLLRGPGQLDLIETHQRFVVAKEWRTFAWRIGCRDPSRETGCGARYDST